MVNQYRNCISHFKKLQQIQQSRNFANDRVRILDANFLPLTDFKRMGIHHVTVPPTCRTSLPHSESHEEEFVFVLQGKPDLWLDGWIHQLKPFDAIGFPAGTGISHSFINNSGRDVELLVIGERTKKENKCYYPLNLDRKDKMGDFWWATAPTRELGPHDGSLRPLRPTDFARSKPDFIVNALELPKRSGFHYPGDSEVFGDNVRLTDALGLKALGLNLEFLAPGQRSSFPHAHTDEEEFAFIISGRPTVWLNGYTYNLEPGDGVAFPPNTNISHCLINNSAESVIYFMVGETANFEHEKIIYPLNPFRNEQCRKKNWLWENPPEMPFGPHPGLPEQKRKDHLSLKVGSPTADPRVKELLALEKDGKLIGTSELRHNFPDMGTTSISLHLVTEDVGGLKERSYRLIEDYCRRICESQKVHRDIALCSANQV